MSASATPTQWVPRPTEPGQILVLLNVGAVFMGTALTIRDLIGERAIFLREQAVGLSTTAYLLAKVCVYTVFAIVQSAIVTTIAIIGKGGPTQGAIALGEPGFELFVDIAATCVASAMLGLLLSSLAKSNEQIMPLLVVAVMSQLVFSGGMIPVTDRVGLDQMSWATPARWGFAASASTIDLSPAGTRRLPHDSHWPTRRRLGGSTWRCWPSSASSTSALYAGRSALPTTNLRPPSSRARVRARLVRVDLRGVHPSPSWRIPLRQSGFRTIH